MLGGLVLETRHTRQLAIARDAPIPSYPPSVSHETPQLPPPPPFPLPPRTSRRGLSKRSRSASSPPPTPPPAASSDAMSGSAAAAATSAAAAARSGFQAASRSAVTPNLRARPASVSPAAAA